MTKTSLQQRFTQVEQGVYFIGTTPPKHDTPLAQVRDIAQRLLERLSDLEFDGIIVYDIQDESSRTAQQRPFPFSATHDARWYSQLLMNLSQHAVICYQSVSQASPELFIQSLSEAKHQYQLENLVLVGSPSNLDKSNLPLAQAYELLGAHSESFHLGGVSIAERHRSKGDEHQRILHKTEQGCDYFITQAVYDAQASIDMLSRYAQSCRQQNLAPKRIILTFSPCGSAKTLEFIQWLGINVPEASQIAILDAEHPLQASLKLCQRNLQLILDSCGDLGIPLGLNIESLTNRKAEIDASILLYRLLKSQLEMSIAQRALRDMD
ncbi:hypothetical protein DBZ36_07230 [Alginatibacterium sediminis]|uniref:Methylenetetrahydrofolate reductase (NAD(P)H) n=1 Tax=Alginatibacterium sediminis TaxID=2164068 RepID=A0A420EIK3_9ALTE|nr:hypothetical protein DBZ36_07230 [Alginatibacterium sediminis]